MFWWPGHTFPVYPKAAFSLLGGFPFPILIILPFTLRCTPAAILSQMCSSFTFLSSFHLWRVWFKFDCTSCIQQGNTRRTRMALYLKQLNVGEAYSVPASTIIPAGCWACHVNFSEMVTKFVFLICRLYWNCEGKFAKVPGYIRKQHEIPCDLFWWHVRLSALKIQALAVPDRENLDLYTAAHQPSCVW